jgi:hypothetical protein
MVHTFAVNPKKGTRGLPLFENISLKEPRCSSLMVSTARDVMVCGGIRRREPSAKLLS